jgi:multicomponent Na+:H+ antiporter subunit A
MTSHPAASRTTAVAAGLAVLAFALGAFAFFSTRLGAVAAGQSLSVATAWVPMLDVHLAFRLDGLSLVFALLVTGTGFFVALYAMAYLRGHPYQGRFFAFFLLFMVAMLGLVLADDLILFFVFWELTTAASFLLIGFDHENKKARESARQAVLVTGAGGLALLAGVLLLGGATGTWRISAIASMGELVRGHSHYIPILALILLGAFTKSAQFPFHFWLPNAMAAPTPVSAYLHSATMVKAGIYLLARLHPTLSGTPDWTWTLTIVGGITAVWGALLSLRATDLKVALAWTTVMALGTLTLFLGSEAPIGLAAAITFLVVHALYKCSLFLVVGNLDHETGTRELALLGGLRRAMPLTALAAFVAALSMSGFPPFLGFLGKELKYEGALAVASEPWFAASASVLANACMVAMAAILAIRPFFGARGDTPATPHEAPWAMLAGPLVMGALGLALGLMPPVVGQLLIKPAVAAIAGGPVDLTFQLFHGITLPLALSVLTVGLGVILYRLRNPLRQRLDDLVARLPWTGDTAYRRVMGSLARVTEVQTRTLQGGRLRVYLAVIFAALTAAVGYALFRQGFPSLQITRGDVPFPKWGVVLLVGAGVIVVLAARTRLVAVCALGLIGAGIALIFVLYGAPDVAITQLMVDILVVTILTLVLLRLPRFRLTEGQTRRFRGRDAVIATAFGLVMAVLVLGVTSGTVDREITQYYETHSVPDAYGRNLVNVILVDFRAFDTLGEIVVLALAGLGVWALLARRRRDA